MDFIEVLTYIRAGRKIVIDETILNMVDNDINQAIILSRLIYWYLPDENGKSKLRIQIDGEYWIAKTLKEWQEETRLSEYKVKTAISSLIKGGIIEKKLKKFNSIPTVHYKLNINKFVMLYKALIDNYKKEIITELEKNQVDNSGKNQIENNQNIQSSQNRVITKPKISDTAPINKEIFEDMQNSPNGVGGNHQTGLVETTKSITNEYIQMNTYNNNVINSNELITVENSSLTRKSNDIYQTYLLYKDIWKKRYKNLKEPILTAKLAGQIKTFLKSEKDFTEIKRIIYTFIASDEAFLISKVHDFGLLLKDLNKYIALSVNPSIAGKFTEEYVKSRMYYTKKEEAKKDIEEKREQENIEKIRLEKAQLEAYKQEQERKKQEEKELLKRQKEELEKQKKEEEKRLAASFKKHLGGNNNENWVN